MKNQFRKIKKDSHLPQTGLYKSIESFTQIAIINKPDTFVFFYVFLN